MSGDETRRLLDAATPGPWWVDEGDHPDEFTVVGPEGGGMREGLVAYVYRPGNRGMGRHNSALIAAVPRLLAGLLAERDAAVARVAALEAAIGDPAELRRVATLPNSAMARSHLRLIADTAAAPSTPPAAETLTTCPTCGWVDHPFHTDAELDDFDCDDPWHTPETGADQ